jgi:hypothetical protein
MRTRSRRWSDITSVLGFALLLFAGYQLSYGSGLERLVWPLFALGCILMFVGFWLYVQVKGYNPVWTLLFFFIGPLAFFIFFFLPDREKQNAPGT